MSVSLLASMIDDDHPVSDAATALFVAIDPDTNYYQLAPEFLNALQTMSFSTDRALRYAEALTIHLLHFECEQL